MTKQELYEKIRAKRNKMFPERMKLEFGCEVYIPENIAPSLIGYTYTSREGIYIVNNREMEGGTITSYLETL